jgi:hypothetical protein
MGEVRGKAITPAARSAPLCDAVYMRLAPTDEVGLLVGEVRLELTTDWV